MVKLNTKRGRLVHWLLFFKTHVMKIKYTISILSFAISLATCKTETDTATQAGNIDIGNKFVDAFYSFDRDSLQLLLSSAETSQPEILYYQKWAECANYKVLNRSQFVAKNDSIVLFPVTVKDDLMEALDLDLNVTDTFHIFIQSGKILSVKTSSNDPDIYYEGKKWVKQNRPELIEKACEGIWEGGPTPCECALGMVKGLMEFAKNKKQ
jgi:hypothetical protein